jgi:hypothetical protein
MRHLLKRKCVDSRVNVLILASTSVPFTLTMVQVPDLALSHKKRITVQGAKVGKHIDHNCTLHVLLTHFSSVEDNFDNTGCQGGKEH